MQTMIDLLIARKLLINGFHNLCFQCEFTIIFYLVIIFCCGPENLSTPHYFLYCYDKNNEKCTYSLKNQSKVTAIISVYTKRYLTCSENYIHIGGYFRVVTLIILNSIFANTNLTQTMKNYLLPWKSFIV